MAALVASAEGGAGGSGGDGGGEGDAEARGKAQLLAVERAMHVKFFDMHLRGLPRFYIHLDTSRIPAVYFAVQALDVLGALSGEDRPKDGFVREHVVDSVYALQIVRDTTDPAHNAAHCGFRSGASLGFPGTTYPVENFTVADADRGNIAGTYSALCVLISLGDDLSRVDREGILAGLPALQQDDGSFASSFEGDECDMRFLYCACAISALLNDWSGVDVDRATEYVLSAQTYDGGLGLVPGTECHGGSTYCGVAALHLMGRLQTTDEGFRSRLRDWCLRRQCDPGFQGRPNKQPDTCYSFWVGASLALLDAFHLVSADAAYEYIALCKGKTGGYSKFFGYPADVMHSFYSLAWCSLCGINNLRPLDPAIVIPVDRLPEHLPPVEFRRPAPPAAALA